MTQVQNLNMGKKKKKPKPNTQVLNRKKGRRNSLSRVITTDSSFEMFQI